MATYYFCLSMSLSDSTVVRPNPPNPIILFGPVGVVLVHSSTLLQAAAALRPQGGPQLTLHTHTAPQMTTHTLPTLTRTLTHWDTDTWDTMSSPSASKRKTKKKHFVQQKVEVFRAGEPVLSALMWGVNHSVGRWAAHWHVFIIIIIDVSVNWLSSFESTGAPHIQINELSQVPVPVMLLPDNFKASAKIKVSNHLFNKYVLHLAVCVCNSNTLLPVHLHTFLCLVFDLSACASEIADPSMYCVVSPSKHL